MKSVFSLLAVCCVFAAAAHDVVSPKGNLAVDVDASVAEAAPVSLMLLGADAQTLLDVPAIGLRTSKRDFHDLCCVDVSKPVVAAEDYMMLTGKRSHCYNVSTDRTFTFVNAQGDTLMLDFRLFNDGLAFRYVLPKGVADEMVELEFTSYLVPDGTNRWFQPYSFVYEDFYPLAKDGKDVNVNQDHRWGYPALLETPDSMYVLITEADVMRGHAASLLSNAVDPTLYTVTSGGDTQCVATNGWVSPWRVLIAGPLADVVESTLVTDVATPAVTSDVDWIKPAPVSWIYWAYNHGSNDYDVICKYIDLAVDMQWPYMLIDAEWDEMKHGKSIVDALSYANSRGVKPLIWYNSTTGWIDYAPGPKYRLNTKEDRLKEYSWLNDMGVAGVKIDFFDGDKVQDIDYSIDLLEDALDKHIMVTLHGATIPRGWQRTFPNLMTVEAVYGAEWYNNLPVLTNRAAAHNATLPFTRNVIGPMDYTPGTFTDSQHPHITTDGHELALTLLFESPLQHMPDRPEAYYALPEKTRDLLKHLPTAWDETRLLCGYPGEYVVMARRKGDVWYIAGINGADTPRTVHFGAPEDCREANCLMRLYADKPNGEKGIVESDHMLTSNALAPISIDLQPRGGFVMTFTKGNNF